MSDAELVRAALEPYPERRREAGIGRLEILGRAWWSYVQCMRRAVPPQAFPESDVAAGELPAAAAVLRRRLGRAPGAADLLAGQMALAVRALVLAGQGTPGAATLRAAWAMLAGAVADLPPQADPAQAAVLAAAMAAGRGLPVHLLTADEEAAAVLAAMAGAPLGLLGLSVARAQGRAGEDVRREAYRADVVCAPLTVVAFDYLRDRVRAGRRLGPLRHAAARLDRASPLRRLSLRGLGQAFVLDAEAVMVDRAHVPLALREAPADAAAEAQPPVLARISLPDFLGRYLRLAACADAAGASAGDYRRLYGLPVAGDPVAGMAPVDTVVCPDRNAKWHEIAGRATRALSAGRRVLVGLGREGDVAELLAVLAGRGVPGRRLDAGSAPLAAGEAGLLLPDAFDRPPVAAGPPLTILLGEGFPGMRLDRRLAAAAARRVGDAEWACVFSRDDEVLAGRGRLPPERLVPAPVARFLGRALYRQAQGRAGRRETAVRAGLLQYDRHLDNVLAFAGEG